MPVVDRTARGQIQLSLGAAGVVLPRVVQTSPRYPYVGWWVQMTHARPGCKCQFCAAARNGAALYVGYHRRDTIERIGVWKHEHPEALAA